MCLRRSFQFALALSDDGRVFSWGFGGSTVGGVGALGHGSKETVHAPKQIVVCAPAARHPARSACP